MMATVPPPRLDPPIIQAPVADTGLTSLPWIQHHQAVADQLAAERAFWASLAASASYADDAAAAAGGVGIGARYRSGSAVMVRVS